MLGITPHSAHFHTFFIVGRLGMRICLTLLFVCTYLISGFSQSWSTELSLVPERTRFTHTSTYNDVIAFLDAIAKESENVRVISMGESPEGKKIPVAVLAEPPLASPEEARRSGKPVVYIQGNIHAGEVEGKEAIMMLMREILLGDKRHLLDNQIILFAPIYNTDGNDKMEKGRRPSQEDSPLEVGFRENSQGFDLNRDGIKMEANETRALITNIVVPWDPQLFVDLHTTNGTWHAYSLTWAPSYHSAGEAGPYRYTRNKMLPAITDAVKQKYDLSFGPYGDYSLREGWPVKNFYTYNHHPRYLVNQFGLRNRMAILSEAFAHERFYQRINSTYHFVLEILEYTHRHINDIVAVNQRAQEHAMAEVRDNAGKTRKGVRFEMIADTVLHRFPTYEYIKFINADGNVELMRTGKVVMLDSVVYHARFQPTVESTLPRGYVIPAAFAGIVDLLRRHGITVTELNRTRRFEGERFLVTSYEMSSRKFEGHYMARVEGKFEFVKSRFGKGDFVVEMEQPLANLIFYLLEPQSDDGIVTWNFLDDYFKGKEFGGEGVVYPIFKYFKAE